MNNRILSIVAFAVLTLLWLAFGVALIFQRDLLDFAWEVFRGWPLIAQAIVGLLALPVAIGLWIWETSWPILLRLVLVVGLAWGTIYAFFPKKAPSTPDPSPVRS